MKFVLPTTFARTRIYRPRRESVPLESFENADVSEVQVPADDGLRLNGWYALSRAEEDGPQPFILYFSGASGHRGYRLDAIEYFTRLGCDLLLIDYRGYGDNVGVPTERHQNRDARTIWRFATEELHVPPEQIIVFGESIGGAVGTTLVSRLCRKGISPGGLVLQATFSRMLDVVSQFFPWILSNIFLIDRYPSYRRIRHVTCPILSIHGDQDRLIPIAMGRRLFDAAPAESASGRPKQFLQLTGVDHNDILDEGGELLQSTLTKFFGAAVPSGIPESMTERRSTVLHSSNEL